MSARVVRTLYVVADPGLPAEVAEAVPDDVAHALPGRSADDAERNAEVELPTDRSRRERVDQPERVGGAEWLPEADAVVFLRDRPRARQGVVAGSAHGSALGLICVPALDAVRLRCRTAGA